MKPFSIPGKKEDKKVERKASIKKPEVNCELRLPFYIFTIMKCFLLTSVTKTFPIFHWMRTWFNLSIITIDLILTAKLTNRKSRIGIPWQLLCIYFKID